MGQQAVTLSTATVIVTLLVSKAMRSMCMDCRYGMSKVSGMGNLRAKLFADTAVM
jgi:hypothetical protein